MVVDVAVIFALTVVELSADDLAFEATEVSGKYKTVVGILEVCKEGIPVIPDIRLGRIRRDIQAEDRVEVPFLIRVRVRVELALIETLVFAFRNVEGDGEVAVS